jgi:hypothetical protein
MEPRRFLLCKSGYEVNILWLDQHGSCEHTDLDGNLYHTRYHMNRDPDTGLVTCLLCPNSLEQAEWSRVFVDDPPGSWTQHFAAYKSAPPKRSVSDEG